jgi:hypothetical protein
VASRRIFPATWPNRIAPPSSPAFGLLGEGVAGVAGQDARLGVDAGRARGGAGGVEGAFGVPLFVRAVLDDVGDDQLRANGRGQECGLARGLARALRPVDAREDE